MKKYVVALNFSSGELLYKMIYTDLSRNSEFSPSPEEVQTEANKIVSMALGIEPFDGETIEAYGPSNEDVDTILSDIETLKIGYPNITEFKLSPNQLIIIGKL